MPAGLPGGGVRGADWWGDATIPACMHCPPTVHYSPLAWPPWWCLQGFLVGVSGELVGMGKELTPTENKWTIGFGFFFGGLVFTGVQSR